jgi:tRNA threonylcarbamoyladenosine biosynthesis protein TsaB
LSNKEFTISEPIILALDTSTKATSIAVAKGAALLNSVRTPADEKRSEKLWTEIQSLLTQVGVATSDVDLFAVCRGPGGFTGLRVGMAAMKGLASATNKSIVGITSLEAAAFGARPATEVCALVNAYKCEVYSQLFSFDRDGVPVAQNEPMVSSFKLALERVADVKTVTFAGDGAEAPDLAHVGNRLAGQPPCYAEAIAGLAFLKYARGELETPETLRACYVRPSEAEIKLSLGLLGSKIKRSIGSE